MLPGFKCGLIFISLILSLQACTVFEIRNKLPVNPVQEYGKPCEIRFSLSLTSGYHTNTFGTQQDNNEKIMELKKGYIESTKAAFNRKSCTAFYSEKYQDSDFIITVSRQLQISATPSQWLCGLSFGIIPGWATKKGVFKFQFNEYSYYIDQHSYCHLFLIPFGLKYPSEYTSYEEALTNYLESNPGRLLKK